jgi:hypothetical protein
MSPVCSTASRLVSSRRLTTTWGLPLENWLPAHNSGPSSGGQASQQVAQHQWVDVVAAPGWFPQTKAAAM